MAKKRRGDMNAVERAIASRESGISRMRQNIKYIREKADAQIADIEKRIAEKQVLLDALKRGNLKVS